MKFNIYKKLSLFSLLLLILISFNIVNTTNAYADNTVKDYSNNCENKSLNNKHKIHHLEYQRFTNSVVIKYNEGFNITFNYSDSKMIGYGACGEIYIDWSYPVMDVRFDSVSIDSGYGFIHVDPSWIFWINDAHTIYKLGTHVTVVNNNNPSQIYTACPGVHSDHGSSDSLNQC